ncbi:hypothetical protein NPIL_691951 [Nephila pilipes]|uniref:Uncharacterized protein n=1 Tax=Nephila pilipes TaxID=299642 RepID=A0A8X6TSC4_NEPPI|nr:hypothetical protein NPIL_691951 [Nephila pilipes]
MSLCVDEDCQCFVLCGCLFLLSQIRLRVGLERREAAKHESDADWLGAEVSTPTTGGMSVFWNAVPLIR